MLFFFSSLYLSRRRSVRVAARHPNFTPDLLSLHCVTHEVSCGEQIRNARFRPTCYKAADPSLDILATRFV